MNYKRTAAVILCCAALAGCSGGGGDADTERSLTVEAMDTAMVLKAYGKNAEKALQQADEKIQRLDETLDRKNENGEIYKLNETGSAELSEETAEVIERAVEISEDTNGSFDITIAPIMDLWGFYSKEYHVPTDDELSLAMASVGRDNVAVDGGKVTLKNNAGIDLGGIAKGYTSGRIAEIFKENGVKSGIVSLGGNVQTIGKKPDGSLWRVAIQDPTDSEAYIGCLNVEDTAVVTSGGYQRYFEEDGKTYHHIIDPATGRPASSGLDSVSIVSEDGALADGLSTALFVMGLDKGTEYWKDHTGFDVVFVTDNGYIYITDGLEDKFESESSFNVISR